jgi:hypothetical protein
MSHSVTQMNQAQLFPDLSPAEQAAIEADVAAAGGLQVVGEALGLAENAIDAGKILSNKIQRNGRHRLSDVEAKTIRRLARERAGRSRSFELEAHALNYEGRWLTSEDIKARKKKRKAALLAELLELEREEE